MKLPQAIVLKLLPALIFSACCTVSHAIPKAAEDENSPVTTGADVAKPTPSKKQAKPAAVEKSKKSTGKKSAKSGKPAPKSKTTRSKK